MFSTLTSRGGAATLDALSAAGASDYVCKPANVGSVTTAMARIREELIPKVKALCGRPAAAATPALAVAGPRRGPRPWRPGRPIEAVVVGVSTGGPNALAEVMPDALGRRWAVPILIVQHMPPVFTQAAGRAAGRPVPAAGRRGDGRRD